MNNHDEESDRIKAMIEILKQHEMRIHIGGCGCCRSPRVSFEYQGQLIVDNALDCNVDMFETGDEK